MLTDLWTSSVWSTIIFYSHCLWISHLRALLRLMYWLAITFLRLGDPSKLKKGKGTITKAAHTINRVMFKWVHIQPILHHLKQNDIAVRKKHSSVSMQLASGTAFVINYLCNLGELFHFFVFIFSFVKWGYCQSQSLGYRGALN